MDTVTHGIAGALIAKALFCGGDMFGSPAIKQDAELKHGAISKPLGGRVVTWALMLGAIFPDSDVFRDMFSHDKLLIVTWHRSITPSLILMPLWALLLAWITH